MDKKPKRLLLFLLAAAVYTAGVVLPVQLWLNGLEIIGTLRSVSIGIVFAAVAVYIAAAFLSAAAKSRDGKRPDVKQQSELFDNTYEYARRAKKKYGGKMRRVYALTVAYIAFTLVLLFAASVAAVIFHIAMLPLSALFFLAVWGTLTRAARKRSSPPDNLPLPRERFPALYSLLDSAAEKLGINPENVRLNMIEDDNASVAVYGGGVNISLGYSLIAFLGEDELFNIMLHELAHVKHSDVRRRGRYRRVSGLLNAAARRRTLFCAEKPLFYWVASAYIPFTELYERSSSLSVEIAADDEVQAAGSAKSYINAGAKLIFLAEFGRQAPMFNVYAPEQPADNYYHIYSKAFLQSLKRYRNEWEHICRNMLPFRHPTHPTFPERMERFGEGGFELDFSPDSTSEFAAERKKAIDIINAKYFALLSNDYADKRKVHYLHYKETADSPYDEQASDYETLRVAAACEQLCLHAHALTLYTHVLTRTPDCFFAQMRKGLLLLSAYDDEGLDLIMSAARARSDYAEEAAEKVVDYVVRRGLAGRLDGCRKWAAEVLQKKINISYDYYEFKLRDKLEENTVRGATKEMIAALGGGHPCIAGIYSADKVSPDGFRISYIGVVFSRPSFDADCEIALSGLNFCLDTTREGDNYLVAVLNLNPAMARAIITTNGSKLYSADDKNIDPFIE